MKTMNFIGAIIVTALAMAFATTAAAQCNTAGMRPDPTGQGRYWMTGNKAPLSVFKIPAYEGAGSLNGLQNMNAAQAGAPCMKVWNEFPDHAEEIILSPTAPLMVDIDRDQVTLMYLDGCRMHGRRYYNRLAGGEQVAEVQPPPIPETVYYPPSSAPTPAQVSYSQQPPQVNVRIENNPTNTNTNTNTVKNTSITAVADIVRSASDIYSTMRNGQQQGQRQGQRQAQQNTQRPIFRQRRPPQIGNPPAKVELPTSRPIIPRRGPGRI